ncbi:creatininase family protein [Paenibacillus piri]|uniref:Creatininase family protein n=2 Tax=Paenibacillus piri TaxID=2547395 RepID=A0A4R5KE04_9BACL|nr:creatininase family protein [Paenibacillus piri]
MHLAKNGSFAVVPLAATEQHGPHLPVYTDSMICEYVVSHSIQKLSGIMSALMTPVLTIGCSQHHLNYGGTLSYSTATYQHMLYDITESLVKCGFRKIIFLNGHGGNAQIMVQAAQDAAVRHPVWTAAASYWNLAKPALDDLGAEEVGLVPGHAGGFETSLIMALDPELIKGSAIKHDHPVNDWMRAEGSFIGKHGELTGIDGFTDSPDKASAEKGRQYLDVIVNAVSAWMLELQKTMTAG